MSAKNNRQSFLGPNLDQVLETVVIGVVGLGGGGSQIVQQLAHIGFKNYVLYDFDKITDTNLNRLVGATKHDVEEELPKLFISERLIRGLLPDARISCISKRWQDQPDDLKACDIIFGCLDGYQNRAELESLTRRALIPYIDIGMDVRNDKNNIPRMFGQVFASIPGYSCMRCYDFINDEVLAKETLAYGDAGIRPQVVWPNSVLAGTAVGLAMNLLMNWTGKCEEQIIYYEYDGNKGTIKPHVKSDIPSKACVHYKLENAGDLVLGSN
ncbi:MAG: ThiF family adenylyltransferase [Syntrophomonadaceae bacterium]|nr:ThiF family adenylyltransferase [Syntrophomonadaceae bacterium]